MKQEGISIIRKEYKNLLKKRNELIKSKEEYEVLLNNDLVKRFIELSKLNYSKIITDKELVSSAYRYKNQYAEKRIYVLIGAYQYDYDKESRADNLVRYNEADYFLYCNIEDERDCIRIKPQDVENFEKQKIVLKTKYCYRGQRFYYDIQQFYFEQLLTSDLRNKTKIKEKIFEEVEKYGN